MTNILFISSTEHLGGPAYSLLRLLDHLPDSYKASVVVPDVGSLVPELASRGIPHYLCTLRLRGLPALVWLMVRAKADLVYANNFHYRSAIALLAARLARRRFVWHIREMVRTPSLSTRLLRRANAVVAVSDASAGCVRQFCPAEKITVIHNGIELREFDLPNREEAREHVRHELGVANDQILVMNLGHINSRKNQLGAISVAAQVVHQKPQVKFCFLGRLDHSPEYAQQVKAEIAGQSIAGNILMPGFTTSIPAYLAAADIYLHTANIDPHPRSVIEAMAARLPVVAFSTDGVSETVVHEETGYLAQEGQVDVLARAILELAQANHLRQEMGARGRARVEQHFTAELTAHKIRQLIDTVLAS